MAICKGMASMPSRMGYASAPGYTNYFRLG